MVKRIFVVTFLLVSSALAQQQQFASIGDFKLVSGETIRDCRIGYRTFGTPNARKSNVILFPTWAGGNTEQLSANFAPGKLVDTSKYYVIAVDALSNGVSSSPSNSRLQPHMHFPEITIRDMVNTQHYLLTNVLGIKHVYAVMGISMGGMQTFQWMTAYPDFMDKAIPIVGSPQMGAYDVLQWHMQIGAIEDNPAWKHGDYTSDPGKLANTEFAMLQLTTPQHVNESHTPQEVLEDLEKEKSKPSLDANDKIRQTEAMMAVDLAKDFGGSLEAAAHAVKAKTMIVVSRYDHTVTPDSARKFAQFMNVPVIELTGDCGHLATACEEGKLQAAVEQFLQQ